MESFRLIDLVERTSRHQGPWFEFFRTPSLSLGIYHLKAGQADLQHPHFEDEIYYIISGRASFQAGTQRISAEPGRLIFVERHLEHRFFDITEDLTLLVFFTPPEGSLKNQK